MYKFKVGDKVRRIKNPTINLKVGDISTVIDEKSFVGDITEQELTLNNDSDRIYLASNFELVKYKGLPRTSYVNDELYEAWIQGADIQCIDPRLSNEWNFSMDFPKRFTDLNYRIDPNCIVSDTSSIQKELSSLETKASELNNQISKLKQTINENK